MKRFSVFAAGWEKIFQNDFIYLTFLSYSGVSIEVLSAFAEESKEAMLKKQRELEQQEKDDELLFKNTEI